MDTFCSARYFWRLFALFSRFLSRRGKERERTTTGRSLSIIIPVALCCRAAAVFALCILSLTIDDILYNDRRLQTAAAKDMTTLGEISGAVAIANINLHTQQRGFIFVLFS